MEIYIKNKGYILLGYRRPTTGGFAPLMLVIALTFVTLIRQVTATTTMRATLTAFA